MKIRKNGVWEDYKYPIYESATDTITSLPTDIIADGQPVAAWTISGNMQQTGTPTHQNPITPQETGDKTGNLFDISTTEKGRIDNGNVGYESATTDLSITGNKIEFTTNAAYRGVCGGFIELPNGAESISFSGIFSGGNGIAKKIVFYDSQKTWLNKDVTFPTTVSDDTTTIPNGAKYVRMSFTAQVAGTASITNFMLNSDNTALPYEPYGFKIPISSGNTTTPVYLGEVETTRKVQKLVLTGQENWTLNNSGTANAYLSLSTGAAVMGSTEQLCTHYQYNTITSSNTNKGLYMTQSGVLRVREEEPTQSDKTTFESFLQTQYTNGTPVTVWYVLANETTGIVNEPLRKIGVYADTISNVAEIPTTAGEQTFDVNTTLKPSGVEITYKGWHKHIPKEYNNGSWS